MDAELIAWQRRTMFEDAVSPVPETLAAMEAAFVPWVRARLRDERYLGWIVEESGAPVAGAGLWLMEFPPHFLDVEPRRGYLLNFYVAPSHRGQGLARRLLKLTVEEADRRGIGVVTLHASKYGRPLYERSGFRQSNEMMLLRGGSQAAIV